MPKPDVNKKETGNPGRPYLYLQQSLTAAKKIEDLILALRRQLYVRPKQETFSLNEEVREILQILNYKLIKNNVGVSFDAAAEIKLTGDPVRFSQIILNLLSNAVDAYENIPAAGRRPIKIELKESGGKIYLTIRDGGAGIAPENLPKIFEPFFTTKGREKGLGLGLATAKNIVEKDFGGRLYVYNRLSGGAKFIVKLPKN